MMEVYRKSLYTHRFEGSLHVNDLLYLYEKIRMIAFLRYPDFKKIEPGIEIHSDHGDSTDLTARNLENSYASDEVLSSCNFTLSLPATGNYEQSVSSLSFSCDDRHAILITVEGTDQQQVDAVANTIIYKINPYVSSMNKGRHPPVKHEERKDYPRTEDVKPDKPYLGMNVYEPPVIHSNLTDKDRARIDKDSRKNSIFILAAVFVVILIVAIVIIITSLR